VGGASEQVRRVVLVDDDEDMLSLLEVVIGGEDGYAVVGTARDGYEAVAETVREQPDVILLDLEMPHLDGIHALPHLREAAPNARIIVFSAFPDPYTLLDVVERGADAYVDKANAWSQLVPTMAAVCDLEPSAAS
jgi:DNA-binding NarL/FixJ family response regulator